MNKIVYLIEQPLDERNYDRFGIQTWINRGWDVEVWDLTPCEHPLVWQKFAETGGKLKQFKGYHAISSKHNLEKRFSLLSKAEYFVDFLGYSYRSNRIKMRLHKAGVKMVTCANIGSSPSFSDADEVSSIHWLGRKLKKVVAFGPFMSFKLLSRKLLSLSMPTKVRPSLIVVAGENSIRAIATRDDQEIIKAHNFDYDIYLKLIKSTNLLTDEYGLFIDQNLCFHPEYLSVNLDPYVTPEHYFPVLCRGLRRMSSALGVRMQIAAHPRASYDQMEVDYFEGLPVRKEATAELICQSKFVVGHYSTALQMAVLFKKPLIFVTTNELRSSIFGRQFEKLASTLGKTPINLDEDLDQMDWEKELAIDFKKYDEYRKEYIKTNGSPELPSWDIVINHIERGGKKPLAELSKSKSSQQSCSEPADFASSNK